MPQVDRTHCGEQVPCMCQHHAPEHTHDNSKPSAFTRSCAAAELVYGLVDSDMESSAYANRVVALELRSLVDRYKLLDVEVRGTKGARTASACTAAESGRC